MTLAHKKSCTLVLLSTTMAATSEDSILPKLQCAAAYGVRAGDSLSAECVQTVLRFTLDVLKDYERVHGTSNFLNNTFQACDMKCVARRIRY